MSRYWVIAPAGSSPAKRFDEVWQFDLAHGYISMGWRCKLGDVTKMSEKELPVAVARVFSDRSDRSQRISVRMLSNFHHKISPEDWVVARRGRGFVMAIGKVLESAIYAPNLNPVIDHQGFLKVEWQASPRNKGSGNITFPRNTVEKLSREKFQALTGWAV